jgi:hypothetical protein
MRLFPWLVLLMVAAACASTGSAAAPEPGDSGVPVVMYRVTNTASPHPVVRIPWEDAQAMGVGEATLAPPGFAEQLAARCAETSMPEQCRRTAELCREKTCRIAPVQ